MKALWILCALFSVVAFAGTASAATIIPMGKPANTLTGQGTRHTSCYYLGFDTHGSVNGMCPETLVGYACGRGCVPAWEGNLYQGSWDNTGHLTLGALCATHPWSNQGGWTLQPGFNGMTCPTGPAYNGVVSVNGSYCRYVSTSADGAYELVDIGLVQF